MRPAEKVPPSRGESVSAIDVDHRWSVGPSEPKPIDAEDASTSDEIDIELPPDVDDEHGDEAAPPDAPDTGSFDWLVDVAAIEAAEADGHDDANAVDLPLGNLIDDHDADGGAARLEDAEGLDFDPAPDESLGELEEGGIGEDGLGIGGESELSGFDLDESEPSDERDDGGIEGTDDRAEEAVDTALFPALDESDDDDDFAVEDLMSPLAVEGEHALPDPADVEWERCEGVGSNVAAWDVATSVDGGVVVAAAEALLVVDEGAHAARSVVISSGRSDAGPVHAVCFATPTSALVSTDDGIDLIPLEAARAPAKGASQCMFKPLRPARRVMFAASRLWALSEHDLVQLEPAGESRTVQEMVITARAAGESLLCLRRTATGLMLSRLRSDDEGWQSASLPSELSQALSAGRRVDLVANGEGPEIAFLVDGQLWIAASGTYRRASLPQVLGACFVSSKVHGMVAVVHTGDRAALIGLAERGPSVTLAELPARLFVGDAPTHELADGLALAWDRSREVLWVAGPAGLSAYARTRGH